MTDYQIQASSRRCARTGRDIRPGERYYSVLLDDAGKFVRHDYCEAAWQGPPPGAFSFWKTRLGTDQAPRRAPIDDDLLMECFCRLEDEVEPSKVAFRYVLTLLLLRRKRLRLEDSGKDRLQVRGTRKGERYQVIDPGLADDELESVQDEVFRVLGWE